MYSLVVNVLDMYRRVGDTFDLHIRYRFNIAANLSKVYSDIGWVITESLAIDSDARITIQRAHIREHTGHSQVVFKLTDGAEMSRY